MFFMTANKLTKALHADFIDTAKFNYDFNNKA